MKNITDNYFLFRQEKSNPILDEIYKVGKRIQETKSLGNVVKEFEAILKKISIS
jgi:hypothetical protein